MRSQIACGSVGDFLASIVQHSRDMTEPVTTPVEELQECGTGGYLSRKELREKVLGCLAEAAEVRGLKADSALRDDSVLLESGLDSLGFAVLVVRLEETLGYDPFVLMSEPVYPKTFGEFLDIYERCRPKENVTAC